ERLLIVPHGARQRASGRLAAGRAPIARASTNNKKESKNMSDEVIRPRNLRANAVPVDGYVLSIDGKLKARYETENEATAAGTKLKQNFPVIQISVFDAAARTYTPVELQEK